MLSHCYGKRNYSSFAELSESVKEEEEEEEKEEEKEEKTQSLCNSFSNNTENMCTDISISTRTKIAYLNTEISSDLFWEIPIIPYASLQEGVVKKQLAVKSHTAEEVADCMRRCDEIVEKDKLLFQVHVKRLGDFTHSNLVDDNVATTTTVVTAAVTTATTTASTSVKRMRKKKATLSVDERKISFGTCKHDFNRQKKQKQKHSFVNCFSLGVRICVEDGNYHEYHVKIFNKGKIEIPGVQVTANYHRLLHYVVAMLQPFFPQIPLRYIEKGEPHHYYNSDTMTPSTTPQDMNKVFTDIVVTNSNFNVGFHLKLNQVYHLLMTVYKLACDYNPCEYPGIKCTFYYNTLKPASEQTGQFVQGGQTVLASKKNTDIVVTTTNGNKNIMKTTSSKSKYQSYIIKITLLLFRTGNILIVGQCDETVLRVVHTFVVSALQMHKSKVQHLQQLSMTTMKEEANAVAKVTTTHCA